MADFHFIRPFWLLAIFALLFAIYLLKKHRISQSGWHQLIPSHLTKVLVDGSVKAKSMSLTLPFIIGLLSIVALAGPTWKKLPQPVYQLARGSVLIMDMSYSMYATDLSPNRLTRARYKAIDLLDKLNEGEIGLVAYAGDAFTISPLTEDINNIKLLLPSLSPDLMPELGSNPLAALALANDMLKNAGHMEGDIYWFTDGIEPEDLMDITDWSQDNSYRINVMGVGTKAGAPIKLTNGELMKDRSGAIVIPKLTEKALKGAANRGNYARLSNDSDDIDYLTSQPITQDDDKKTESSQTGDQWQEFGPYVLLIVLPLVLGYFRRGSLLAILPLALFFTPSRPVYADFWTDLWKTKDQQGQKHFNEQNFEKAAQSFENSQWQGSAHYQSGNYEKALEAFQQGNGAQSLYNQGNALAKLQQLEEAIAAYDKALKLAPDHEDARANKELLEKLKQQQDQQKQQNQDQQQNDQENQDQESEQQNDQQQDGNKQDNQEQQDNQQQQDSESSDQEEQQNQENSEQNQQQSEEEKQQEQKEKEQQAEQKDEDKEPSEQEQQAQAMQAQQDKETEQKHKQLLNKVTDDPYLLLRNKMQLEYQKRRQSRSSVGVNKKW